MRVLVTGANGFVGRYLVRRLVQLGHTVQAGVGPSDHQAAEVFGSDVESRVLELTDDASVQSFLDTRADAVIHLAAIASGRDAGRNPVSAWEVNTAGAARIAHRLLQAIGERGEPVRFLLASTVEVYGPGPRRSRLESDATHPVSTYAASKLAAEIACLQAGLSAPLEVIVARATNHTGSGQSKDYVVPAFAARLLELRRTSSDGAIRVGNLTPVRDFLHVQDVVTAYVRLVQDGEPGEVYNVSSGEGTSLSEILERLSDIMGMDVQPVGDPSLERKSDVPHLVADNTKLKTQTGWSPEHSLADTLRDVLRGLQSEPSLNQEEAEH